jgi:tripartite-type tricarboxylate transporter receptor subunit TctC
MHPSFQRFIQLNRYIVCTAITTIFFMSCASAQTECSKAKNVTIYVAFAPGAFTDVIARIVG